MRKAFLKVIINIFISSLIIIFLINVFGDAGLFFAMAIIITSWLISRIIITEDSKITGRDNSTYLGLILLFHIIIPVMVILFSGILKM